jgi:hypothetical protein
VPDKSLSDERLAEIEKRCAAATPGPWAWRQLGEWHLVRDAGPRLVVLSTVWQQSTAHDDYDPPGSSVLAVRVDDPAPRLVPLMPDHPDAALVAGARDDMPLLLAEVRRLRAVGRELRGHVRALVGRVESLAGRAEGGDNG